MKPNKKRRKKIAQFAEPYLSQSNIPPNNTKSNISLIDPVFDRLASNSLAAILKPADENPDQILKKKGAAVYDEMERKDGHLYAIYETRKVALSMVPWHIAPADNSERAQRIAEFVFQVIDDIRGPFCEKIKASLDGIGKGFSVLEICWAPITKGKWKNKIGIEDLIWHKQKYWEFKERKFHKDLNQDLIFFKTNTNSRDLIPVPWTKVIHYAFDGYETLYGKAAFEPLYYYYWFKKECWKSWMIYLNRFGFPTTIGTYSAVAKRNEKQALLDIVQSIQEETGVIIPEGMQIKFLEAMRSGTASYGALSDACNAEESKGILGATQTVQEGKKGSYALARAHSDIREIRVDSDTVIIADIYQQQLVNRIVDFNFITDEYPQFIMSFEKPTTTQKQNLDQ